MIELNRKFVYFFKSFSNYHKQGNKKNIFLFSTPRSGSTWLMEMIAAQPKFKYFDEPLNIRRYDVNKAGYFDGWDSLMPEHNNEDIIISYLQNLELNRLKFMNPPAIVRKNYRFYTDRIIFKIHEIEHMVNTIKERLNAKIIYVLRHPIPTILSRHIFPRLNFFIDSEYYQKEILTKEQLRFIHKVQKRNNKLEIGALSWCYQNVIPLNYLLKEKWLILTYEELVLNPYKCCEMLHLDLELDDFRALLKMAARPASNIKLSDEETVNIVTSQVSDQNKTKLVTKWKDKVTKDEEQKVLDILAVFDIDAYCKDRFVANDKYLHFDDTKNKI